MRKIIIAVLLFMTLLLLASCSGNAEVYVEPMFDESRSDVTLAHTAEEESVTTADTEKETEDMSGMLRIEIGDDVIHAVLEDNGSADEFASLLPLTVSMSGYGGFEQVGSIGKTIKSSDVRFATSPGDIVLYSGDQVVMFYGSNTWSYTLLGKVIDEDIPSLEQILSAETLEARFSLEE